MERTEVDSSNVASIGYDAEHEVVEVEFKGGRIYHYPGVSQAVWEAREDYGSIGKFVAAAVKPSFSFEHGEFTPPEVEKDEPEEETPEDVCDSTGHNDEVVYEDETGYQWRCLRCGAEGWEDAIIGNE